LRHEQERRVWLVMEWSLSEFDRSPQARPELWPLISECLALILACTPQQIIAGARKCGLDTGYLMSWIIFEGAYQELADQEKLRELEMAWRRRNPAKLNPSRHGNPIPAGRRHENTLGPA
jgi:hypothetical protein